MSAEYVIIRNGSFRVELYLVAMADLPLKNIRRLLSLMLLDPQRNKQAIHDTELYLEGIVRDSKRAWDEASIRFQLEWRLIDKPIGRQTRAQVCAAAKCKAHNNELTRTVKTCKAKYERWVKIQTFWNDTKRKNEFIKRRK